MLFRLIQKFTQSVLGFVLILLLFTAIPGSAFAEPGMALPEPEFSQEEQLSDFPQKKQVFSSELQIVSKATNINPENLRILDEREATFSDLEGQFKLLKVLDEKTGESKRLAFDAANNPLDYDDLLRKNRSLHYQKFGSMEEGLYLIVEQSSDERTIPVLIKLNLPEEQIDKSMLPSGRSLEAVSPKVEMLTAQLERRSVEAFRNTMNQFSLSIPEEILQSGPFISTKLSTGAIRKLSSDPRIAFIGLDQEQKILDYPTIPESLPTTRTNNVHSTETKGAGINIAVLESGGLDINQNCFNIGAIEDTSAAANSHMTKSVGIIGNRYNAGACNGSWQGYAPEATVLLANDSSYTEAYDWAKTQGVNVITMSWHYISEETSGDLHSRDVYFDYATTHSPYPTVFTSAGNQASTGAYASGKGYNFFGVGDILNDGDENRCNDVISSSSSWKDPISPNGDREVPEIASPGSRHELLGSSFGGTSCATPVTASIASLLMSTNPSLKIWPEAIRATLLASANYQGADGADWSKFSDGKDGTGMTNTQYSYWIANRRETTDSPQFRAHDYGSMRDSSFSDGFFTKTWKAKTSRTDSRIRVALTWNSKTTSTSSTLDADLDLKVYDPDMNLVASSNTWDSNYEFVEFTPSKVGDYTIKIRGYSIPSDFFTYYGVAWTTHYDLCP